VIGSAAYRESLTEKAINEIARKYFRSSCPALGRA